jgi:hypothetical protein
METSQQQQDEITYDELVKDALSATVSDDDSIDSNDEHNEEFARYENDPVQTEKDAYDKIAVNTRTDEWGWKYYVFDNKSSQYLSAVLFSSNERTLVNLNGTILPLSEFLDVTHIAEHTSAESKITDLRSMPNQSAVLCKTSMGAEFTIPKTSISVVMKAVAVLSDAADDEGEEPEFVPASPAPHRVDQMVAIACTAFSFLAGLLINRQMC